MVHVDGILRRLGRGPGRQGPVRRGSGRGHGRELDATLQRGHGMSTISTTKAGGPVNTAAPRKVIPLRHPGRIITGAILLVLLVQGVIILVTNPNFEWPTVASYLFATPIMQGLWL